MKKKTKVWHLGTNLWQPASDKNFRFPKTDLYNIIGEAKKL